MEITEKEVKAAVQKMCGTLSDKGVVVKHSLMLEAFSHSLGLQNWRTLKAKLMQTSPKVSFTEPREGSLKEWTVEALYLDNDQPFSDFVQARTGLEASINLLYERWSDGYEMGIFSAKVKGLNPEWPNCKGYFPGNIYELRLHPIAKLLKLLLEYVERCPQIENDYLAEVLWLRALVKEYPYDEKNTPEVDLLEDCMPSPYEPKPENKREACGLFEDIERKPSEALRNMVRMLEFQGNSALHEQEDADEDRAIVLYQVLAWVDIYESLLDDKESGLGMEGDMP